MNFKELIISNKLHVKNIIKLITKQENEDLEQEVFIKAWKNSHKYEERGSFKSWITTIAKNVSKDYLKSATFKNDCNSTSDEIVLNTIKDNKLNPEKACISFDRQTKIINAIESLKPKLKETILLCEIYGYTYEEASKKLNCPIGTVKSRIYNAKKELSEILKDLM